jgi:glucose-1-phosphate thymidylyltransferase
MAETDKAVILARGLGTRMRKADNDASLDPTQSAAADTGVKALIPIDRPFLDYVLHVLAESGYRRICLVIGPEHHSVRDYYGKTLKTNRLSFSFAVQEKPLGTANAVAAAEEFAGNDPFLIINSDNHYPREAVEGLRKLTENGGGPGLAGFERESLIANSNIPADRINKFAIVQAGPDGYMQRIVEKPDQATIDAMAAKGPILLSMNCWMFTRPIFEACRNIKLSPRGEYEIPDAVQYTMEKLGQKYRVLSVRGGVLDMSSRGDIPLVAKRLAGSEVRL